MKTITLLLLIPIFGTAQINFKFQNYYGKDSNGLRTDYRINLTQNEISIYEKNLLILKDNINVLDNGNDTLLSISTTNTFCKDSTPVIRHYVDVSFKDSLLVFKSIGLNDKCSRINEILRTNLWCQINFKLPVQNIEDTTKDEIINTMVEHDLLGFRVYPNPASNFINVDYGKRSKLIFTNIQGSSFQMDIESGTTMLDISTLQPGVYFMRLLDRPEFVELLVVD